MIQEFSDQLFQKLEHGLLVIVSEPALPHILLRDQLVLVRGSITELTRYVNENPFSNESEEIRYQKIILPRFKAQLIYHVELYNLQLAQPLGDAAVLGGYYRGYFMTCLDWIEQFKFYYLYRKLEAEELDELYFTASGNQRSVLLPVLAEMDEFSTAVGHLYAKFLAYELLYDFMAGELKKLVSGSDAGKVSKEGGRLVFDGPVRRST